MRAMLVLGTLMVIIACDRRDLSEIKPSSHYRLEEESETQAQPSGKDEWALPDSMEPGFAKADTGGDVEEEEEKRPDTTLQDSSEIPEQPAPSTPPRSIGVNKPQTRVRDKAGNMDNIDSLLSVKPASPAALKKFVLETYGVLKTLLEEDPERAARLNEKLLSLSDDAVFHLIGGMLDFRDRNYQKALLRMETCRIKSSRLFEDYKIVAHLYVIRIRDHLRKKFPSEEANDGLNNAITRFYLHYKPEDFRLPEFGKNFNHALYLK